MMSSISSKSTTAPEEDTANTGRCSAELKTSKSTSEVASFKAKQQQPWYSRFRWPLILVTICLLASLAIIRVYKPPKNCLGYLEAIDRSIKPCDDFYAHACGKLNHSLVHFQTLCRKKAKPNRTKLLAEAVFNGTIYHFTKSQAMRQYLDLLTQCVQLTSDNSKMVVKNISELVIRLLTGGDPWPVITGEEVIDNGWMTMYADFLLMNGGPIFDVSIMTDMKAISTNMEGLLIGEGTYYNFNISRESVAKQLKTIFGSNSTDDNFVEEILQLNAKLAWVEPEPLYYGMPSEGPVLMTLGEFKSNFSLHLFSAFFDVLLRRSHSTKVLNDSMLISVHDRHFLAHIEQALANTSTRQIKNYLGYRFALSLLADIKMPRTTDHLIWCNSMLGSSYLLVRLHVDAYKVKYGEAAVDKVIRQSTELAADVRAAFREMLQQADWLDATTKSGALRKLQTMVQTIGWPEWLFDDDKLDEIHQMELFKSKRSVKTWQNIGFFEGLFNWIFKKPKPTPEQYLEQVYAWRKHIYGSLFRDLVPERYGKVSDLKLCQAENAYYTAQQNSIIIPFGILKFQFTELNSPLVISYGSLGTIIGHEITHGFDQQGSGYDESGQWHNWWSSEARAKFEEKTQCFVKLFTFVEPTTGQQLLGVLSLNEDLADSGGLKAAFLAYEKHRTHHPQAGKLSSDFAGFTDKQLFFYSYAHSRCTDSQFHQSKSKIQKHFKLDHFAHTLPKYRVNLLLSNFAPFAEAFNCSVGTAMNPDREKCALW